MAREVFPPSPAAPPVPVPLAADGWRDLLAEPELACAGPWAEACASWWAHAEDRRLRERTLGELVLTEDELATWLGRRLDRGGVVGAHEHVVSMRAGLERDTTQRKLDTDGLRTGVVWSRHRGGGRTLFVPAEDVPRLVDELCAQLGAMPAHPFLRAAWIIQAIGAVHPFRDANGGASRFLASLELARLRLPPFTLGVGLRNSGYIHALMESNQSGRIDRLARMVADVTQRSVAGALLSGDPMPAAWSAALVERAERWCEVVAAAWRAAVGDPLAREIRRTEGASPAVSLDRLVRRGYRVPVVPAPRCASWSLSTPVPVSLDVVVAPVRAGAATWLVAMTVGGVGAGGELGALGLDDLLAPVFVAVDAEPDDVVDRRYQRWAAARVRQYAGGLSQWT